MGNQISKKRKKMKRKDTSTSSVSQAATSCSSNIDNNSMIQDDNSTFMQHFGLNAQRYHDNQYFVKYAFQKSHMAPIEELLGQEGSKCLDVCCTSTPMWLIDMAVEYPNATFVGIDIAINPDGTINDTDNIRLIPKNCQFQQIDVLKEIILPPNSFDYIYQRFLYTVYSLNQVESKFKEFVGLLKPGGYMELVEYDLHPKQIGPKFTLIIKAYANVVTSQNKELYHGPHLKQCLTDAGLEDINGDYISIPICWGGNMGKILYELINEVLSQFGAILWPWLELEGEYDKDVYFEFVDSAFNECVEYKTYFNLHWATGRKPLNKAN